MLYISQVSHVVQGKEPKKKGKGKRPKKKTQEDQAKEVTAKLVRDCKKALACLVSR